MKIQITSVPNENFGGKKKGQYGLNVDPYQPIDLQTIQGQYPQQPSTALQNPTPNIPYQQSPTPSATVGKRGGKGIQFGSMNINLGAAITGLAGAANMSLEQANVAQQAARNQRLTLQQETYNPYQFGNGSQALFEQGGKVGNEYEPIDNVPEHVYDISPKQKRELEKMGYIVEKIK